MTSEQRGSLVLVIQLLATALASGEPGAITLAQTQLDALFPREKRVRDRWISAREADEIISLVMSHVRENRQLVDPDLLREKIIRLVAE